MNFKEIYLRALFGIIYVSIVWIATSYSQNSFIILYAFMLLISCYEMWQLRKGKSKIFAFTYILFPLSIIQIFALNSEIYLDKTFDPSPILMMLVLTWTFDTFAYIIGSKLGKNKIAPKLSPKKSWEGFGGGLISTLIICYLITDFNLLTVKIDNFNNYTLAIFIPFTASLGDFIESYYKRQAGVKNSGKLIPGHGGILDRIDALMITIPFLYLYINLI